MPKDKVDVTYLRNGKESKTSATLGESKTRAYSFNFNDDDFKFDMPPLADIENFNMVYNKRPKIGLQIQDVEEGTGVTVKDVDEDTPASKAGLKEGDVITQVNGKDIAGVDELREQIKELKEGDKVTLSYKRNGTSQTAEVKIPKRLKSANL